MAQLKHIFQPKTLQDIVGQPLDSLINMMVRPTASCWMLVGDPGTGKTAATRVVADMLGCEDEFTGFHHIPCSDFGKDAAKDLFYRTLRMCSPSSSRFHCVVFEEFQYLSPQTQLFLKDALDPTTNLPKHCIFMATSNDLNNIDDALLERFRVLNFISNEQFAVNCMAKIERIWRSIFETGLPFGASNWGRVKDKSSGRERFSMRLAIQQAEDAMESKLTALEKESQHASPISIC